MLTLNNGTENRKIFYQLSNLFSMYYFSYQNLTGGCQGGIHVTDVTNASRTQLMSLRSLQWDKRLLRYFEIPQEVLPKIRSSAEIYGYIASGALTGVPIAGVSI